LGSTVPQRCWLSSSTGPMFTRLIEDALYELDEVELAVV
jgi:hypothetical protein